MRHDTRKSNIRDERFNQRYIRAGAHPESSLGVVINFIMHVIQIKFDPPPFFFGVL